MKVVFTNGCFDLLHPGHIDLLTRAKALGDRLIVGINSDESVRTIKGPDRPIQSESSRKTILEALKPVDKVFIFNESTPERLIRELRPDVLVKGGDWKINEIVGADFVTANGGSVYSLPLVEGHSTTSLLQAKNTVAEPQTDHTVTSLITTSLEDSKNIQFELSTRFVTNIQRIWATLQQRVENGRSLELISDRESEVISTVVASVLQNSWVTVSIDSKGAGSAESVLAFSISGSDSEFLDHIMELRQRDRYVIGIAGANGKKLTALCDDSILIPTTDPRRMMDACVVIANIWQRLTSEFGN